MKTLSALFFITLLLSVNTKAQNNESQLPYHEIPPYPESYSAGTVAARLIDGLGFRYYWATEGLRSEDLEYRPSEAARTTLETLDHIYGLSQIIVNSTLRVPNDRSVEQPELSFEEKRRMTLLNLQKASNILKECTQEDIEQLKIIFKNGENTSEFPFWNQLNGPVADALWHAGQVVSFRRSSGNPINPNVSVFSGKLRK